MPKPLALLLAAIEERGLEIVCVNGQPRLKGKGDAVDKEATPELMAAMKFFRKGILDFLGITEATPAPEQVADEVVPPEVPEGAVIVVADKDARTDKDMRSEPHMWCWVNGPKWYYVSQYPVPKRKET